LRNEPNCKYFDVEGVPVTLGLVEGFETLYCAAWDQAKPRPFPADSARRNGAPISQEDFLALRKRLVADESKKSPRSD